KTAEHRGGIKDWPAHIVQTTAFADQSARVHVSNQAIILNGIVLGFLCHSDDQWWGRTYSQMRISFPATAEKDEMSCNCWQHLTKNQIETLTQIVRWKRCNL